MQAQTAYADPEPSGRAPNEVAEIFRRFGDEYRATHALTPEQLRVMNDIEVCRTHVLGGHLELCQGCDFMRPVYNSCNNRHCPKCQAASQARWLEARMERVLPTHYFHVVFTLPAELRPLVLHNRRRLYELLFRSATGALLKLCADKKRLGAQPGLTAVLHSWARDLSFHPHLHCIVTGGGLTPDGSQWLKVRGKDDFLLPVKVVGSMFRGKFLRGLEQAWRRGELTMAGSCAELADEAAFKRTLRELYRKKWVVYAKRPFGGPEQVFSYLGRYTHRVGLSNHRLQRIDAQGVRFATRDGKSVTIGPLEFIRRFLLHVLPSGFKKIRHYGLCAPANVNTRLEKARGLLEREQPWVEASRATPERTAPEEGEAPGWVKLLLKLTGKDVRRCPRCGQCELVRLPLMEDPPPS